MSEIPFLDRLGDELEAAVARSGVATSRREGWWVAAGAFAMALVFGGGMLLMAPFGGDPIGATTTTTTSVPPSAFGGPGIPVTWARVPSSPVLEGEAHFSLSDVAAHEGGFIAVGSDVESSGTGDPTGVIVRSVDGISWEIVERFPGVGLSGVESDGGTVIAAGYRVGGSATAVVSTDGGKSWRVDNLPHVPEWQTPDQNALARDVGFVDGGIVIVGQATLTRARQGAPTSRPAVWSSRDGVTWTAARGGDLAVSFESDMTGVAVDADGHIVAVGLATPEEGQTSAAAWVSDDGTSWRRAAVPSADATTVVQDVAVGSSGFVAVGATIRAGEAAGAVWVSDDGATWERIEDPSGQFEPQVRFGTARMNDVAWVGDGYVAVGVTSTDDGLRMVVWTSPDAEEWSRSDLADPIDARGFTGAGAVAAGEHQVVIAGISTGRVGGEADGAVWVGPAPVTLVASEPIVEQAPDLQGPELTLNTDRAVAVTSLLLRGRLGDEMADTPSVELWLRAARETEPMLMCEASVQSRRFECRMRLADLAIPPEPGDYEVVLGDPGGVVSASLEVLPESTTLLAVSGSASPKLFPFVAYVRVRNDGAAAVDLGGWSIVDSTSDERRFAFPAGTVVEPGAGAVLSFTGQAFGSRCAADTAALFHWCRALGFGDIVDRAVFDDEMLWQGGDLQLIDPDGTVHDAWDPAG